MKKNTGKRIFKRGGTLSVRTRPSGSGVRTQIIPSPTDRERFKPREPIAKSIACFNVFQGASFNPDCIVLPPGPMGLIGPTLIG